MKKKNNNTAFSLVEVIVVVAIMAVLMGILVPTLVRNTNRSKRSVDVNAAGELAGSLNRIFSSDEDLYYKYLAESTGNYTISWNSSTSISSFDSDPLAKALFDDYANLPVSKWKKGLTWEITFNADTYSIHIYLVDSLSDTTGYELYPESNAYIKQSRKKAIE